MEVDTALRTIRKHQQAFALGVIGAHNLREQSIGKADFMRPLRAKIAEDVIHAGFHVFQSDVSPQLEQATVNRLGMQLVVGTGDAVKAYTESNAEKHTPNWADSPYPEIRFLRQVRNGAAHDNRFDFEKNGLRAGTQWRGCELQQDLDGDWVFTDIPDVLWGDESVEMEAGIMEAGDALALSVDIIELLLPESNTLGPENFIGISEDVEGWEGW